MPFQSSSLRKVLKVSSVNLGFKSYNDKLAIVENFGRFLNSLTHPIQIVSDTKLINPDEWLLKMPDQDYYEFLKDLVNSSNVSEKIFYIAYTAQDESELKIITDALRSGIKRCRLLAEEVEPEISQSIPVLKPGHVKVGDWYNHTLIVKNWPHSCVSGWLENLYNLDKNITLSMFIEPQNKQDSIKYISKRLARLQSNSIIKDKENKTNGEEDESIATGLNMREELMRNEGNFFFVSYYITVKAKSLEQLKRDTKFVKTILNGMMIETSKATLRHDDGYRCSLPLMQNNLRSKAAYTFTTTPLKRFFPFMSANIVDKGGIMIGSNLLNNSLIFLDHFSYSTASMVVIGKTGSGKSFTVKAQIDKLVKQGVEVTVLDIEKEFDRMQKHKNLIVKHFGTKVEQYKQFLFDYWEEVNNGPKKPRFLVIDEFWSYKKDPEIADLLQKMAKLGRKRWLGICPITQEVNDMLSDEFSKSLINNSSIKIILQIDPNQRKLVQETFGLTDSEVSFLIGASEGEGILFAGTNHVQFKTIVSDKQYAQITTKPQELYQVS
ncbi:gp155 [Bacillus phage G]|uniref:Gp155 n=1 Tax=Bacillus phage G TaxID=2884420 RepID=G3MBM1_9CAUD|nr:gp155 [Bacillus phage G]AEO93415.1 gp155 [Bacillus phage G]